MNNLEEILKLAKNSAEAFTFQFQDQPETVGYKESVRLLELIEQQQQRPDGYADVRIPICIARVIDADPEWATLPNAWCQNTWNLDDLKETFTNIECYPHGSRLSYINARVPLPDIPVALEIVGTATDE